MTFVYTGAWFALYVPVDPHHEGAAQWLAANPGPLVTTDYVIDETLTLFRARGQSDIALDFGADAFFGRIAAVHYLSRAEIAAAWDVFRTFANKDWSFTDCTSRVAMEVLGIGAAFAFDRHFRQFGTTEVVP